MTNTSLATPDVTAVQKLVAAIGVVITAVIAVVNVFGWAHVSLDQSSALLGLWAAVGSVAMLADAHIRNGRASVVAAEKIAIAAAPAKTARAKLPEAATIAPKTPPARKPAAPKAKA